MVKRIQIASEMLKSVVLAHFKDDVDVLAQRLRRKVEK